MTDFVHNAGQSHQMNAGDVRQTPSAEDVSYEDTNSSTTASSSQEEQVKFEKIKKMLRAGFKVPQIMQTLNVSQAYVYKIKKELPPLKPQVSKEALQVLGYHPNVDALLPASEVDLKKHEFLQLLYDEKGLVFNTIKQADIHYNTYARWKAEDPIFAKAVADIKEMQIEWVEAELFKQIASGAHQAATFYLKTKGRKRGYTERVEVAGVDDAPIQVRVIKPHVDLVPEENIIDVEEEE